MFEQFRNHVNENFSFLEDSRLIVAISGGIDSVVLAHLCYEINLNFALAHCNFNLRGEESDADESFVLDLAEELDMEVFIESFDTDNYAIEKKLSIQMAARELRYNWFMELAEQLKFDFVLTAHHADDNLETFLINLSRGTGLEGLTGIPEINNIIIRPLLPFSREEIESYAKTNKLKWRDDTSNSSTKYLRNKLRLHVIPTLKEINPQILSSFKSTQGYLLGSRTIIDDRIDNVFGEVMTEVKESEIQFDIDKIIELSNPRAYLYEFFKDYGFTEWNDVEDLLEAQSGKYVYSKTHRLIKDRKVLILSENHDSIKESIFIAKDESKVETSIGTLVLNKTEALRKGKSNTVHLDKDLLKFPLILRKWHEGDYFYPFGMKGKKKLSKFFKDEKLSLVAKENTWLLCSGNDVVWLVNQRLDDRYKVTERTKDILKITLQE